MAHHFSTSIDTLRIARISDTMRINTERADFRGNENQPLHSRILTGLGKGIDHA